MAVCLLFVLVVLAATLGSNLFVIVFLGPEPVAAMVAVAPTLVKIYRQAFLHAVLLLSAIAATWASASPHVLGVILPTHLVSAFQVGVFKQKVFPVYLYHVVSFYYRQTVGDTLSSQHPCRTRRPEPSRASDSYTCRYVGAAGEHRQAEAVRGMHSAGPRA